MHHDDKRRFDTSIRQTTEFSTSTSCQLESIVICVFYLLELVWKQRRRRNDDTAGGKKCVKKCLMEFQSRWRYFLINGTEMTFQRWVPAATVDEFFSLSRSFCKYEDQYWFEKAGSSGRGRIGSNVALSAKKSKMHRSKTHEALFFDVLTVATQNGRTLDLENIPCWEAIELIEWQQLLIEMRLRFFVRFPNDRRTALRSRRSV